MQSNVSGRNAAAIGLIALILASAFIAFAAFAAWAGGTMGGGMMGGSMMAPLWFLLFALFPLVAIAGIGYAVVRAMSDEESSETGTLADDTPTDPVERLREQYVAGELTEAEFERAVGHALDERDDSGTESASRASDDRVTTTERRRSRTTTAEK